MKVIGSTDGINAEKLFQTEHSAALMRTGRLGLFFA